MILPCRNGAAGLQHRLLSAAKFLVAMVIKITGYAGEQPRASTRYAFTLLAAPGNEQGAQVKLEFRRGHELGTNALLRTFFLLRRGRR